MRKFLKVVFRLILFLWVVEIVSDGSLSALLYSKIPSMEHSPSTSVTETKEDTETDMIEVIEEIDPSRPGYNMGRSANLCSDVQVMAFFLDDQQEQWTSEEVAAFTQSTIRPGLDFIQQEAARYGVQISLNVTPLYTNENRSISFDGVFGTSFTTDNSGKIRWGENITKEESAILSTLMKQLKFDSNEEMHASFQQTSGCEQIAYLVIPKKSGYTHSYTDFTANGYCGFEHTVLYPMDVYGNPTSYKTVAKYLLSVFGGGYSIESWEGRESTNSVARRMYPYSVILGGNENCCSVDPYTAYAVGWRNILPPENNQMDLSNGTPQPGDPYRPMFDKGTCRNLSGRVSMLTVFVDDYVTQWTQEEIDEIYQNRINPAVQFLTEQARQRNIWLEFDTGYYATDASMGRVVQYQGVLDEYGFENHFPDVLDHVALSLGFSSKQELHDNVLQQSGADQLIIMVAVKSTGRSFAVSDRDDNPNHNVEYFVMYRNHWKTRESTAASTVAHEMLHLFGAEDMYVEPDNGQRYQRDAIAKKSFPRDLMYTEYYNIWDNIIDAYTAYAIGWSDVVPQVCTSAAFWE